MRGGDAASLQKLEKDLKFQEKGLIDDNKQITRLSDYIANAKKPRTLLPGMNPKNLSIYKLTAAGVSRTTKELEDVTVRKTKREAAITGLKQQIDNEKKFIEEAAKQKQTNTNANAEKAAKQKQTKTNANAEKAARMKKIENNSRIRAEQYAAAKAQANFNTSVTNAAKAMKNEEEGKAAASGFFSNLGRMASELVNKSAENNSKSKADAEVARVKANANTAALTAAQQKLTETINTARKVANQIKAAADNASRALSKGGNRRNRRTRRK